MDSNSCHRFIHANDAIGIRSQALQYDLKACLIRSDKQVNVLGIFEYFNDTDVVAFLQHILRLVKPGGKRHDPCAER